ncbi:hypothetical protein, partial [Salmonella sp. s55004]|uniref:hypothetical protein n=1 Tax=Salmonella sp. s55004 TaxID=3159675 RepID=UPI003980743D
MNVNIPLFSLGTVQFSLEVVEKRLRCLSQFKACGPDGVHPFLLKRFANFLAVPLALIYQRSMDEGSVPDDWKCANVAPIFKKG